MKAFAAVLPLIFYSAYANAADYPSVREIEQGLSNRSDMRGALSGAPLPIQIPARGRAWTFYYVSARAVGNGQYDVRVRLR